VSDLHNPRGASVSVRVERLPGESNADLMARIEHMRRALKGETVTKRLGRLPNDPSKPRLTLRPTATIAPPPAEDWISQVPAWNMAANDRAGCCTCSGAGHMVTQTEHYGQAKDVTIADADTLKMYTALSGYNPKTGANDDGASLQDALNYWRKTGLAGYKIEAFAQIDASNLDLVRACISIFGAVYTGFNFPAGAMDQFDAGKPWTVPTTKAGQKVDGGHCVPFMAYDPTGFTCVTWGKAQKLDLAFYQKYFAPENDVWVAIDTDWLTRTGNSPDGLDVATLNADYAALTGKPGPFTVTPAPSPVPAPQPVPAPSKDADLLRALRVSIDALSAKLRAGGY